LTRLALATLAERGELAGVEEASCTAVRLAALLHDVGHYPFSHSLEEAGFPHHEKLGVARLSGDDIATVLESAGIQGLTGDIGRLITGTSNNPLGGLISGSLDLDKIEYLSRDAHMCGVPYGMVDVNRLLAALTLVEVDGKLTVGVQDKGLSALESLLFAKYQMYRNVYWHHAVRSATCMFKRAVRATVAAGGLDLQAVSGYTDGALTERLMAADPTGLARALHNRRLFKRSLDLPASELPDEMPAWLSRDPDLLQRVEDYAARRVGLEPGELLIDYPERESMLALDLPLRTRTGSVERLTEAGREGELGLPRVADELYRSARRLRIFVARQPTRPVEQVLEYAVMSAEQIEAAVH
ncbi:MAG: HD domain-containing protein, partial [Gemmatimonadales bacterium]